MSTAPETVAPRPTRSPFYEPPVPELGEAVLFRRDGSGEPEAALVVRIGSRGLTLHVMTPGIVDHYEVEALHVGDPDVARRVGEDLQGTWDFTPMGRAIRSLLRELPVSGD